MVPRFTLAFAARALVSAAWLVSLTPAGALAQTTSDAAALTVFADRIDHYARLRGRLEEPLPPFDDRRGAWPVMLTRRYLASTLRAARPQAGSGAIFTPPVADLFRRLIAQRLPEVDPEGLSGWDADLGVEIVVHEPVPAWSRLAIPHEFLELFPPLPDGIEYRMVNDALVLWDAHAEIVVDVLPAVFMAR